MHAGVSRRRIYDASSPTVEELRRSRAVCCPLMAFLLASGREADFTGRQRVPSPGSLHDDLVADLQVGQVGASSRSLSFAVFRLGTQPD